MALSFSKQNGDGATTNFTVSISYLNKSHIKIFVDAVETLAFTWVSDTVVQITPAPPSGSLNVEIRRVTPRNVAVVDFSNGSVLFDTDLDNNTLQSLFIAQEYFEQADNLFPTGHALDSHTDALPGNSVAKGTMRVYDNNSKWKDMAAAADGDVLIGDTTETRGVRWLAKGTDGQALEVDTAVAGKLAWVQSLRKVLTTAGDIFYATAAGVITRLALGTPGQFLIAGASAPEWQSPGTLFSTADVKLTFKVTADPGWVLMNDGTIGSASSGASNRANADTETLYTHFWDNVLDKYCPITGGRGDSAAADFAADKAMRLPKALGRALATLGTGTVTEAGVDNDVDTVGNTLTVPSNNIKWITGMAVTFNLTSGTITGLVDGTVYYVQRTDKRTIRLATTLANAQNSVTINFTAKSSPVWDITHSYVDRELGEHGGEGEHAMHKSELLSHTHTRAFLAVASATGGPNPSWGRNTNTGSTGGNKAMNITQSTLFLNVMVKL